MKLALQYLSGINEKPQAVQLPLADWQKVLAELKKYEQILKELNGFQKNIPH